MNAASKVNALTSDDNKTFDSLFDKGVPVVHASIHQALQVPGLGSEKTLMETKFPGIKMSWTPVGLLLKIKDKRVTIPAANVVNCLH